MNLKHLTTAITACCLAAPSYANLACEVKSGSATAALVELYTSEGCSSCPPADLGLRQLRSQLAPGALVVPLAMHVSYWNGIGWVDPFSQKIFDQRQQQLLEHKARRVAYTPQFFVNGDELRNWDGALPATIKAINSRPAPVTITLKSSPGANNSVLLEAQASATNPATRGELYLAISESGLSSQVKHGENGGRTLRHDDTVRLWLGPIALAHGNASVRQQVTLPAGWQRDRLQAVALVQDPASSTILQALSTEQCAPTRAL
jgi:hypothetical protein